ncbi:MAG: hypothetical protein HC880_19910 [Bacteroidia bacterium]|nr:hypothetical protein [Bacteroidia bacterium]
MTPTTFFSSPDTGPALSELCQSLHCLLLAWIYYASETGLNTLELMRHYENGQALLQHFQKQEQQTYEHP